MKFTPSFSEYKKKVSDSFEQQEFMNFIGAQLSSVEPGYCEIRVPYNSSLTQQNGYFHAGVISTIADNSAGYAAFSLMEEHAAILTIEIKLNFLSPGKGDWLIGKGHVMKYGRTLTVSRSDIYVLQGGIEKLCAVSQSTLMQLKLNS